MKNGISLLIVLIVLSGCSSNQKKAGDQGKTAAQKAQIFVSLGMAYMQREQYAVALKQFNKALEMDETSSDAHTSLADLYEKIKQPKLAKKHYLLAIDVGPKDQVALNNYGKYLCANGEYEEAAEMFKKAADTPLHNRPWVPLSNAGQCLLIAKQYQRAESGFRTALAKNPQYTPALLSMAKLAHHNQDYRKARAFLQRYDALTEMDADNLLLAVQIERALDANDAAAEYEKMLRTKFPHSPQAADLK